MRPPIPDDFSADDFDSTDGPNGKSSLPGPSAEERASYLQAWEQILWHFLGWPKSRVAEWAGSGGRLTSPFLTHESPARHVAHLLFPPDYRERTDFFTKLHLCSNIEYAIRGGEMLRDFDVNFDWEAARRRVIAVLQEHGLTLPSNPTGD